MAIKLLVGTQSRCAVHTTYTNSMKNLNTNIMRKKTIFFNQSSL